MLQVFGEVPAEDSIYVPEQPFVVRNNCQVGRFLSGEEDLGATAEFLICSYRQFYGDLGMTKNTYWGEIFGYPISDNFPPIVFRMFFKSISLKEFNLLINRLLASRINPAEGIFSCGFNKLQKTLPDGTTGNYYHLVWGHKDLGEEKETIERLASTIADYTFPLPEEGDLVLLPSDGTARNQAIAQFKAENSQKQLAAVRPT